MPITFKIASHDADQYTRYRGETTAKEALNQVWHPQDFKVKGEAATELLDQSLDL
jgi:hypothetical protein